MVRTPFVGPRGSVWAIDVPTSRTERVRGARGRSWPSPRHGMLFERCRSVHTFGMRFPISIVGLDGELVVVFIKALEPRRVLLPRVRVRHIVECRVDADVRLGDRFEPLAPPERRRGEAPSTLRRVRRG